MKKNMSSSRLTPEEKRLALIKTQRETTRVVKRTLIAIAVLAGLYYLFLLKTQTDDVDVPRTIPVSATSIVESADKSNALSDQSSENAKTPNQ